MSSLSNDEILEWNSALEFVRRTKGIKEANKQKRWVDYFKSRNITFQQLTNKSVKQYIEENNNFDFVNWSKAYKNVDSIIQTGSIQPI